jgi:hypothetical protein
MRNHYSILLQKRSFALLPDLNSPRFATLRGVLEKASRAAATLDKIVPPSTIAAIERTLGFDKPPAPLPPKFDFTGQGA